MTGKDVVIFSGFHFGLSYKYNEKPNKIFFKLHNHENIYEIVLFLDGDCEFCVEGNIYNLKPYDVVFTRPFEMHNITCLTEKPYERIILYIESEYFEKKQCENLLDVFVKRDLGTKNLIPAEMVKDEILNSILRIKRYVEDKAYSVADNVVYEFLYLLNNTENLNYEYYVKDKRIRDIIIYINNNLSENITLEHLSQKFYINKFHLCKMFKKNTGYTFVQYINYKRILLVQEYHKSGQSLLEASINAGFNNYSNFYKTYLKNIGQSPKHMP